MPLDIKLKPSVIDSCETLIIQDITGDYNSEINTGGWGGFNAPANSGSVVIVTSILLEVQINPEGETRILEIVVDTATIMPQDKSIEQQTYGAEDTDSTYSNPITGSIKDFRLRIPQSSIREKIMSEISMLHSSYGLTSTEANYVIGPESGIFYSASNHDFSKLFDSIYTVTPTYVSADGDIYTGNTLNFTNTCLTQQHVDDLTTSVDFRCEDCDDSDLEQIHLAHSLLDTLKNI
tara:strand:- start:191 stop:895 length:705 start_codon:yes stop_codon:yes gene_type:complete